MGREEEAERAYQAAIAVAPERVAAYQGLGSILADQGRLVELIEIQRKIVELAPENASAHSNLIFTLCYDDRETPESLSQECRTWGHRHEEPLRRHRRPHDNGPDPGSRLRIGYISPDFREHVVARLLRPILQILDRSRFEVFCYSDVRFADAVTHEVWRLADVWRSTAGMDDPSVAELIRDDQIDLLVELCGHFGGNRLAMLCAKPAPVIVRQTGSCCFSGVSKIDYRFSDPYSDPPEAADHLYSEMLWRPSDCAICYRPPERTPDVGALPALTNGSVSFCVFNNLLKITDQAVAVWGTLLHRVPTSRLYILGRADDRYNAGRFARHGIAPGRIECVGRCSRREYLELHNRADIALDTFPFNGDNTTCNALWMGVPVVTMTGEIFARRHSFSHLSNIGLGELAVDAPERYVRIAVDLAEDRPRLASLKAGLRDRMLKSPLSDPAPQSGNGLPGDVVAVVRANARQLG